MIPLSAGTRLRIEALFPIEERVGVAELLTRECGDNLPLTDHAQDDFWDRIHFAVLKLSSGDLKKLQEAIEGAKYDWRDTLVAAGFGESVTVHRTWFPDRNEKNP